MCDKHHIAIFGNFPTLEVNKLEVVMAQVQQNKFLSVIYTFFLGILLALFIGFGINTFYTAPSSPEYPNELNSYSKEYSEEREATQKAYDKKVDDYNKKMQPYNRNVSIITLASAVVLLAVSIATEKRGSTISNGVMLGGLFTLLYSIGRGIASQNSKYIFAVIAIDLAIVLYLGYRRFSAQPNTTKAKGRARR